MFLKTNVVEVVILEFILRKIDETRNWFLKQINQININFIDEKLAVKVILDCRTTSAHKFRTWLGFRQNHVVLIQEKSVLTKTMSSFERKNIYKQYNVLIYSIGSYVWDYKLTVEIDENGQSNRNIDNKILKSNRARTWL